MFSWSFVFFFMKNQRSSIPGGGRVARGNGGDAAADHEDGNDGNTNGTSGNKVNLDTLAEEIARRVDEIEEHDRVAEASDIPERLRLLKQNVPWVVYDFLRAGLFEKDKLTVMTLITLRIMVDEALG